ncbi:MAG: YkgJ family cysteine cluster protein [Deltaproteobacteria bacterium]
MPLPLELPTIQNWSCHNCAGCCRQHAIDITDQEHRRIVEQNWTASDGIRAGQPLFERVGIFPWSKKYRLAHQPDGACVFLDERGLCRIHGMFGEEAKPLACRVYPYAFHPAGKKIAVSLRFSCPSVAANRGRSVAEQEGDLKALEKLVVPAGAERTLPPEIYPGLRLDWPDTLKIIDRLDELIAEEAGTVIHRLLRGLKLVELVGQSRFEKIRGARLDEFLDIISEATATEVPEDLAAVSEPSRAGRLQFRLLCAQYARRDTFAERQAGWLHRWRLFLAAVLFARGRGPIPRIQDEFAKVQFSDLERGFGPLSAESDEMLTRYLRIKLKGMHFCGAAYYNVPLVEGFQSLALVVPAVLWIARWLAAGRGQAQLATEDVAKALTIADHHHGYSPAFGQRNFRGRVRLLALVDDIAKLAAWYSR